jgi:Rad3-related DNA helicase
MNTSTEQLQQKIKDWTHEKFSQDFVFRKGQLETITDIVETFFEGERNLYLLDAPTGSGKSIIAMIVAGYLTTFDMRGYILASDLSLQSQYEKEFRDFNLNWGCIKGVDNYTCAVNGEKFSLGDCRIKNISYEGAEDLLCFRECGYLSNRKRAIASPVALLNYSYWLIQRNYVEGQQQDKGKGVPFPKRDFTICDEAHKLPEIVQNHFSPRISLDSVTRIEDFFSFLKRKHQKTPRKLPSTFKQLVKNILDENSEKKLFLLLKEVEMFLSEYVAIGQSMKETIAAMFPGEKTVPKEWRFAMSQADWVKDMHCKFEDYNHILSQVGVDFMIKNPQEAGAVVFNCLEERYMMNKYFHDQAGFKLLMTATMGNGTDFLKAIGGKKCKYKRLESTFNFEKSPIYFYPEKKMSLAQRDANFEWLRDTVTEVINKHPEDNGIIHSGSYEISGKIFQSLDKNIQKRIVTYSNSQEKEEAMRTFILNPGKILMGPSLLEGINLFEERSRFQIFVKIPFPSLGDKYVRAKMNYSPEWYDWKTIIAILQGIGRSVRSENDWAVTYVLDGCLKDLIRRRRSSFPDEFQQRIKLIKLDI